MKRVLVLICAFVMVFALVGCGYIGGEKAISIALADQGIDRIGTAGNKADLDKSTDPATYKVTLDMNTYFIYYYIDAQTGDIISNENVEK
jgi:uncharacterized membrane protein YkoI